MSNIKNTICEKVSEYVASKGASLAVCDALSLLETPADSKMGDLALPCFKLSKLLRTRPDGIASELAGALGEIEGVEKIEAVGGYLNFFFGSAKYLTDLKAVLNNDY